MQDIILLNSIIAVHFAFIVFVVFGGLLLLKWRWLMPLHLGAVIWGIYIELSHSICPLTPLEQELRQQANLQGYSGGFIEHYLYPVIYPQGLTADIQIYLAAFVFVINLVIYIYVFLKRRV